MTTATTAAGWVPYAGPVHRETLRMFLRSMVRTETVRKKRRYAHPAVNAVTAAANCGTLTDGNFLVRLSDRDKAMAGFVSLAIDCNILSGRTSDAWEWKATDWWKEHASVKADLLGPPLWQQTGPPEDGRTWYYLPPHDGSGHSRFAVVNSRYYDLMMALHPDASAMLERSRPGVLRPVHFFDRSGVNVGAIMPIPRDGPAPAA
jgi:hypothetical protein